MKRINLYRAELEVDADDPPGYNEGRYVRVGPPIGAEKLAANYVELPPGQGVCPYHYEVGEEEWLIVLEGTPSVRHPEGTDQVEAGDVICFRAGPDGAHKIFNEADATARILIVATKEYPAVAVYPDSEKVGVFTEGEPRRLIVRQGDGVDYWHGES